MKANFSVSNNDNNENKSPDGDFVPSDKQNSTDTPNIRTAVPDKAKEALRNGEVLNVFAQRFSSDRTKENMIGVLSCLRDTFVFVPAKVKVDGIDPAELAAKGNPVMLPAKKAIAISPQILASSGGDRCIPIYSLKEHIQKDKLMGYSVINMPYVKVVEMMRSLGKCDKLVLDPFSYNIMLTEKLIDISLKLKV